MGSLGGSGSSADRVRTKFGDACEEWLRYVEHDRQRAPSTLRDYRNTVRGSLLPAIGDRTPLDQITTETIDALRERLLAEGRLSRRSVQKVLVLLHGILKLAKRRKWISTNPAEDAERVSVKRSGDFNVLSPEQVYAVTRAAESEQDAALFTVAAFSGLRMGELRALRWRDVDFAAQTIFVRASYTAGAIGPPKSGKIRSVPLIDQAARALDGLSRRELHTEPGDLVFPSPTGGYPDDGKIRKRLYAAMEAAGIDRKAFPAKEGFTFHDLRHTFGTLGATIWPLHDLQGYMGHANIQTTMIYAHHVPKTSAAAQLTEAIDSALSNGGDPNGSPRRRFLAGTEAQ